MLFPEFYVSINYFWEIRNIILQKNNLTSRDKCFFMAYFLYSHDGMSDQKAWHSRKASKIKASGGFWGRFSKPQKIQFYRWHSVFGVKKTILRQWDGKNLTAFFRFWKSTKSGFKKNNHFLKEIWSLWKRNKFYFERNCIFVDIVRNIFFKREEEFRCNKKINLFCENQLN